MRIRNIINSSTLSSDESYSLISLSNPISFTYLYNSLISKASYDTSNYLFGINTLYGNSEVVNQQCDEKDTFSYNGITFTNNHNGTWTFNGTASPQIFSSLSQHNVNFISGHSYLFLNPLDGGSTTRGYFYQDSAGSRAFTSNQIWVCTTNGNTAPLKMRINENAVFNNEIIPMPQLIDLTQRYPFDTPTSLTDNRVQNIIEKGYIPPNSGTIKSSVISEIEAQGFNIWNEEWEVGTMDSDGNDTFANDRIRAKDWFRVMPNTTYYVKAPASVFFRWRDINGNPIPNTIPATNNGTITTPANAYWLRIGTWDSYGNVYNHDICINISSSENGTYKPYQAPTKLQLPAPVSIGGQGTSHDTFSITDTAYVFTRNNWKYTFNGSESWSLFGSDFWYCTITDTNGTTGSGNKLCSNGLSTALAGTTGNVVRVYLNANPQISTSSNMNNIFPSGTALQYPLATPQTISIPKKHLGFVHLADLDFKAWNTHDVGHETWRTIDPISNIKTPADSNTKANIYCIRYITATVGEAYVHSYPMAISITTDGKVNLYDSTQTNYADRNSIKQALQGFYMFYETENEVADFTNKVAVQSGGTLTALQSRIPLEYQELEYIESSGTQYIDTGLSMPNGFKITAKVELTKTASETGSQITLFGSQNTNNSDRNYVSLSTSSNKCLLGFGSGSDGYETFGSTTKNILYNIEFSNIYNNRYGTINGTTTTLTKQGGSSTYCSLNMALFGINYNGTIYDYCPCKLYSFKAYSNGVLVRNFIPCYRRGDGVVGLYDLVNGVFYTNQGTGTFLKGNDITSPACDVLPNVDLTPTLYVL